MVQSEICKLLKLTNQSSLSRPSLTKEKLLGAYSTVGTEKAQIELVEKNRKGTSQKVQDRGKYSLCKKHRRESFSLDYETRKAILCPFPPS